MPGDVPPYSIKVRLFPGADPASDSSLWGLPVDVSTYVRYPGNDGGQPITYTAGKADEASQVDSSTMTLTLDNRDGRFSTRNAMGPYYGLLALNTPIIMGTTALTDTFTRTIAASSPLGPADTGQSYTVTSLPSWSVDGSRLVASTSNVNVAGRVAATGVNADSFEMRFDAASSVVATGGILTSAIVQGTSSNYVRFQLDFKPGGALEVVIARAGTPGGSATLGSYVLPVTYTANQVFTVAVQRIGARVMMKAWATAGTEPAAWMVTATEPYATSVSGALLGLYFWRHAENTNVGSTSQYFDNLSINAWEFVGNVVSWPGRWDKTGRNCWAPIQATGILRRLQQGSSPLRSPLARQLPAYGPTGYWPLEDISQIQRYAAVVTGTQPAVSAGVTAAGDSTLAGGGPAPVLANTNGFIRGTTSKPLPAGSTGFSAMVLINFAAGLPASKQAAFTLNTTGAAQKWVLSFDATGVYLEAIDRDGTVLSSQINSYGVANGTWTAWQLETDISGANTTWQLFSHEVGSQDFLASSGSHAGNAVSTPRGWSLGGSNLPAGTAFAHLWLGPNTLPFVDATFSLVSAGYRGEMAGARLARLAGEEGIPMTVEPGTTETLGIQPQANVLQALRSAADSDMGVLYERANGLGYRPRSARYQQPVLMALTVSAGQIDQPPEPIDDDQRIRNQWTVSQDGGSYAIVRDQYSVADVGLYEDSITVSLADEDRLAYQAGFRVYLGTRPDLRWPGLTLDLARNPSLLPLWRSAGYGFRMQVTTGLTQVAGSDPDVIAEGYSATLWPHGWKIALNCSAATPWDITTLSDDLTRLASDASVLDTAVPSSTFGSVQVDVGAGRPWAPTSTLPAEVPFLIRVGGEIMRVTSVGNVFSGTKQTLVVDRGINGVARTWPVGTTVDVAYPMILAY